jgi:hypothetical protein
VRANKTDELKQGTMARTTRRHSDAALMDIMEPMELRQEMPPNDIDNTMQNNTPSCQRFSESEMLRVASFKLKFLQ